MVVSDKPVEGGMKMSINHTSPCLPYTSATLEEAKSAPKAGPPPASPPWGVWNPWHLDIHGHPFPPMKPSKMVAAAVGVAALGAGVAIGRALRK